MTLPSRYNPPAPERHVGKLKLVLILVGFVSGVILFIVFSNEDMIPKEYPWRYLPSVLVCILILNPLVLVYYIIPRGYYPCPVRGWD